MGLRHVGMIELPANAGPGGFDHAAVHGSRGLLYAFLPETHRAAVHQDGTP